MPDLSSISSVLSFESTFDGPASRAEYRLYKKACVTPGSLGDLGGLGGESLARAESILRAACHPDVRVVLPREIGLAQARVS